jgi:hypothetical protein
LWGKILLKRFSPTPFNKIRTKTTLYTFGVYSATNVSLPEIVPGTSLFQVAEKPVFAGISGISRASPNVPTLSILSLSITNTTV